MLFHKQWSIQFTVLYVKYITIILLLFIHGFIINLTADAGSKEEATSVTNARQMMTQSNEPSLDDQLNSIFANQCARIANLKSNKETSNFCARLESIFTYLYESKAPNHIVYHGFLEYFIEAVLNQGER